MPPTNDTTQDPEIAALEAELAAEQEKIDALKAKREPTKAEKLKAELAAAKQERAEAELVEALEGEHGAVGEKIALVRVKGGQLVAVKKPSKAIFFNFMKKTKNGESLDPEHVDTFVRAHVVHPDKVAAAALFEEYPGALIQAAGLMIGLASPKADAAGK